MKHKAHIVDYQKKTYFFMRLYHSRAIFAFLSVQLFSKFTAFKEKPKQNRNNEKYEVNRLPHLCHPSRMAMDR